MAGNDRYDVNPLDDTARFADRLQSIERRLSALEGAPLGGTFTSETEDGDGLVYLGALPDDTRGLEVVSAANDWDLVKLTTDGWIKPHLMGVSINPSTVVAVTSGTFQSTVGAYFGEALGPGVEMFCRWATDSGTTGELQISSNGGATSDPVALPAASNGGYFVRWLHDLSVGSGPFTVTMKARRTAGTGNVNVSQVFGWVQDPAICTEDGDWVAV
jgi:hypothetical protein